MSHPVEYFLHIKKTAAVNQLKCELSRNNMSFPFRIVRVPNSSISEISNYLQAKPIQLYIVQGT